jgi:plastocyanin
MSVGVAVAVLLFAGAAYGMSRQGAYATAAGPYAYGGGFMAGGASYANYGGYGGMMGGYAGYGGYGGRGMMGGFGGMMGQFLNYAGQSPRHVWNTSLGPVVAIANYGFYPSSLTVSAGSTVTWVNMDFVQHTVTSGSEQSPTSLFDSHELSHMQSFSYTFNTPGTYTYYCDVHPEMVGTVVVTE